MTSDLMGFPSRKLPVGSPLAGSDMMGFTPTKVSQSSFYGGLVNHLPVAGGFNSYMANVMEFEPGLTAGRNNISTMPAGPVNLLSSPVPHADFSNGRYIDTTTFYPSLIEQGGSFMWSFWIKGKLQGSNCGIVGTQPAAPFDIYTRYTTMEANAAGQLYVTMQRYSGTMAIQSSTSIFDDKWNHVVVIMAPGANSAGAMRIIINNVSDAFVPGGAIADGTCSPNFRFGHVHANFLVGSIPFTGKMARFRHLNTTLGPTVPDPWTDANTRNVVANLYNELYPVLRRPYL